VFESRDRLARDIQGLLGALRKEGEGRYACLFDPQRILFEDADPAPGITTWPLRRFLERRISTLFGIPRSLHSGEEMEDVFEDWAEDGFFLIFVNGRVGAVVACPDPEALEKRAGRVLKVLVDRLVRYNSAWRADERGRGYFFSRPRLDTVVVGRQADREDGLQ
jgi:hypothetical protein